MTIGSDDEIGQDGFVADEQAFGSQVNSSHAPEELHAELFGSFDQQLLQHGPADTHARPIREVSLDGGPIIDKSHASEGNAARRVDHHAQLSKRYLRIGHKALTAGFLDRRYGAIRDSYRIPFLAERNRGR